MTRAEKRSDSYDLDPSGSFDGTFTVVSGTGGLASLHGHGTFEGTSAGTYEGQLVFAP